MKCFSILVSINKIFLLRFSITHTKTTLVKYRFAHSTKCYLVTKNVFASFERLHLSPKFTTDCDTRNIAFAYIYYQYALLNTFAPNERKLEGKNSREC